VGEKILLDALIPAVTTFELKIRNQTELETAIRDTVDSAKKGMEATINMKAKHGRDSWHQEQSLGVQDAGASLSLLKLDAEFKNLLDAPAFSPFLPQWRRK
jgi:dihydroxyacetone kinase-like protein